MAWLALVGVFLVAWVLYDTFHTIVMPGTVNRRISLTTSYYSFVWRFARAVLTRFPKDSARRETLLGVFGPASLIGLIGVWAIILVFGFGFIQYGLGTPLTDPHELSFGSHLYMSAVTFFTLGYGDMTAQNSLGRFVAIIEVAVGFSFLAIVIAYIPVLYQSFSRREAVTVLLDARAGSPPTAAGLLQRHADEASAETLLDLLKEYERWSAQVLESYLSYPVLATYRSQHATLSWLACLTCILDTCAWIQCVTPEEGYCRKLRRQAAFTYAMSRHLAVDLAYIKDFPPIQPKSDRLAPVLYEAIALKLSHLGHPVKDSGAYTRLCAMRKEYEPYLEGLGQGLLIEIPGWAPADEHQDSWQTTAWDETNHF